MQLSSFSSKSSIENKEILPEEIVMNYYKFVDKSDLDSLFSLFSINIIYNRCEQKISGIDQLKLFYKNVRKINGKHTIIDIIVNNKNVAIRGKFNGEDSNGNVIMLDFADFFELGDDDKIIKRQTYLANGFDSTK